MISLSFIMKCLCPHSPLAVFITDRQLLFLNFSVGRTSFLHLDLKYAECPRPVNVLPALTPLPCIPNLTRRCPLKSLFGFCHFLIFSNLYFAFVCPLCFYFCLLCVFFIVLFVNLCSNDWCSQGWARPEGVSSVNGCFNPNSVCLGNCIFLVGSQG